MHDGHDEHGARQLRIFINMLIFATLLSALVFSMVYFLFLQKEVARVIATITETPAGGAGNQTNATTNVTAACDDACFTSLALKGANSSYCKNVSAAGSDGCWEIFSTLELSSCLELRNYSMKKSCLSVFLAAEKNASLCDHLNASDRAACLKEVAPPCTDVPESERGLCLARTYQNGSYCTDIDCSLTYATETNDSGACDGLSLDAEKYACRGVIGKTNKCAMLTGVYTLDYCYQLQAKYSGDYAYCHLISSDGASYGYRCYLDAALKTNDSAFCSDVDLEYMWDCYTNYSLESGDISGCRAMNTTFTQGTMDNCLRTFALKFTAPAACNYMSGLGVRITCYGDTILQAANLTVESCIGIMNPGWQTMCFSRAAKMNRDASICSYITDMGERANCQSNAG